LAANASEALATMNNGGSNEPSPRERCLQRCDSKYVIHGTPGPAYLRCQIHCKKIYKTLT